MECVQRNIDMIPPAIVTALLVGAKAAGKSVGTAILNLLASLLAGKTLRVLLYRPLAWLTGKTESKVDDTVVEAVREDWQLPPETEKGKATDASK